MPSCVKQEADRDGKRHNMFVKRAGSVLSCSLDFTEEVADRKMLARQTSIRRHPQCRKEHYRRLFLPTATRLNNAVS